MHPSGIQFGLSRGLLQLRGEEVLLSDQLVEAISAQAQLHLQKGRHPIQAISSSKSRCARRKMQRRINFQAPVRR